MGDSCFNPGMKSITKQAGAHAGVYSTCIPTGNNDIEDTCVNVVVHEWRPCTSVGLPPPLSPAPRPPRNSALCIFECTLKFVLQAMALPNVARTWPVEFEFVPTRRCALCALRGGPMRAPCVQCAGSTASCSTWTRVWRFSRPKSALTQTSKTASMRSAFRRATTSSTVRVLSVCWSF